MVRMVGDAVGENLDGPGGVCQRALEVGGPKRAESQRVTITT